MAMWAFCAQTIQAIDTTQLARLLTRAETSPEYLTELMELGERLAFLVDPAREEQAWSDLINELSG